MTDASVGGMLVAIRVFHSLAIHLLYSPTFVVLLCPRFATMREFTASPANLVASQETAWHSMPLMEAAPGRVPKAILKWVEHPFVDMSFGKKILMDMSKYTDVLI